MNSQDVIFREQKYFLGTYNRFPVVFVEGAGVRLRDLEGREYLDLMAGIAVNILGYAFTPLQEAVKKEVDRLLHTSNLYYNVPQVELAERLVQRSGFSKVFLVNSGAEANEVALKMARFYGQKKHGKRYKFISFYRSFHGRTFLTLGLTGQEKFHHYLDPFPEWLSYAHLNDIESVEKVLDEEVCGVIVEPIQGEGGIYPCTHSFLQDLEALCQERDLILIFDEVQCGMGRTGRFFAFEYFGVQPDLVTMAKGLGGGLPIGAVLVSEKIVDITEKGEHGSTFGGNPVCSRAACVVVDTIGQGDFLDNVRKKGELLAHELKTLQNAFSGLVKETRGVGLIQGLEVPGKAKILAQKMFEHQVLVNA
ncbi:MAG: acetylornithine/succinylornithine family transaminase, partial [Candidatus Caldatribacteriaceae bacterium]